MSVHIKYRALSSDELQELEPEFIRFLASQGVTAADWEKLKRKAPDQVRGHINHFSNLVLARVLGRVELLERRTQSEIHLFRFAGDKVQMNGLRLVGNEKIDFRRAYQAIDLGEIYRKSDSSAQLLSAEKAYTKDKPDEVFALIRQGCLISKNDDLFDLLEGLKKPGTDK